MYKQLQTNMVWESLRNDQIITYIESDFTETCKH